MRILVLGINYLPEEIGIAVYSGGLCEGLARRGHEVKVVTAKPYYPDWRVFERYRGGGNRRSREGDVDVTRVSLYVPPRPSGAKRLLHHASFAAMALIPTVRTAMRFRPDLVLVAVPSLASAPVALIASRIAGAKSWVHVQDFEVEAAVATGLLDKRSIAVRLARRVERSLHSAFDVASSISLEMCRKLGELGIERERVYELRNWAEIKAIQPLEGVSPYRERWGITTPEVALYSGNIGNKQGLEIVIETARLMHARRDLTFVICGQGPNRARLEALADGLDNIQFHDLQPREAMNELLGMATVHLLPQRADAADLVLPSKLSNMLASGRPVVAGAAPGTGLWRELEDCGIATRPDDAGAFAEAIEAITTDRDLHARCSRNARQRALLRWDKEAIIDGFERRATDLVGTAR